MAKIKVNTLWSLEDVKPIYIFDTKKYQVVNTKTGHIVKVIVDKRGYPVVGLQCFNTKRGTKNVKFHKIVALAMIDNKPYELIEHLDDNPLNYHVSNLKFSNKRDNMFSLYRNGRDNHYPKTFLLRLKNGRIYIGTTKQLAKWTGIPRGTLYDIIYGKWDSNIHGVVEMCKFVNSGRH